MNCWSMIPSAPHWVERPHDAGGAITIAHNSALQRTGGTARNLRVIGRLKAPPPDPQKISTETALEIDRIIRETRVVDWISKPDIQNEMRNRIDDCLYELKNLRGIDLSIDDMDSIIENSIDIARAKYA